jgi:hypothetical protein
MGKNPSPSYESSYRFFIINYQNYSIFVLEILNIINYKNRLTKVGDSKNGS